MEWAPSDIYSKLAPRILSAFPRQEIICGIVGNDIDGQLIVFRPSDKYIAKANSGHQVEVPDQLSPPGNP
jgi:hypothetical protein